MVPVPAHTVFFFCAWSPGIPWAKGFVARLIARSLQHSPPYVYQWWWGCSTQCSWLWCPWWILWHWNCTYWAKLHQGKITRVNSLIFSFLCHPTSLSRDFVDIVALNYRPGFIHLRVDDFLMSVSFPESQSLLSQIWFFCMCWIFAKHGLNFPPSGSWFQVLQLKKQPWRLRSLPHRPANSSLIPSYGKFLIMSHEACPYGVLGLWLSSIVQSLTPSMVFWLNRWITNVAPLKPQLALWTFGVKYR